jgi:hypothetical protein
VFKLLLEKFSELPTSVQRSFVLVFIAWAAHFFTAYVYILKEELPYPQLVVAMMLFMGLIFIKKWGRFICVFFTGWAMIWYLYFVVSFYTANRFDIVAVLLVNIALYAASIYYLMKKDTIRYFKARAEDAQAKVEKDAKEYKKKMNERAKLRNTMHKSATRKKKK